MAWVLPRYDQLLRDQRQLPADKRQSQVLLTFGRPVPKKFLSEFERIVLTPRMLTGGEEDFFEAALFQPHRVPRKLCPLCRQPMDPIGPTVTKCRNPRCLMPETSEPTSRYEFHRGPVRGVVCVLVMPDFVCHREHRELHGHSWTEELVDRALLVLDRRYHPVVLAAVKRTAALICEDYGWGLK